MPSLFATLAAFTTLALAVGLAVCLRANSRARSIIGRVVEEHVPPLRERRLGALAIVAVGAVAWFGRDMVPASASLPLVLLALAVQFFRPAERLRAAGEDGVQLGWYARRYDQLEEWRLTGDHLRFRLLGVWQAVELDHRHHDRFRRLLEARAGGRQSVFKS